MTTLAEVVKILRTWPLLTSSQARNLARQARQTGKGGFGGRVGGGAGWGGEGGGMKGGWGSAEYR